jgi:hypothetical protein
MNEETKTTIREALARQERFYRGTAESERINAIHCRRSGDPVIRARAENLDDRATDCDKKADSVLRALEEFNRENVQGDGAPDTNTQPPR